IGVVWAKAAVLKRVAARKTLVRIGMEWPCDGDGYKLEEARVRYGTAAGGELFRGMGVRLYLRTISHPFAKCAKGWGTRISHDTPPCGGKAAARMGHPDL